MTLSSPLYLDHAATSPFRPEAREAYLRASEFGGNASSVHAMGRKAKVLLEDARALILRQLEGDASGRIVFTSGATEANALALHQAHDYDYLIVSETEHDSIYASVASVGKPVLHLPVLADGQVDVTALERLLSDNAGRAFVSIMMANNETGVISPDVSRLIYSHNGWLHADAVQALGKIGVCFDRCDADSISLSAHKIGGPQGVGAFIYHTRHTLKPFITGGGQELGLRAGTENVPGAVAFAAALEACGDTDEMVLKAQSEVEAALKALGATIIGETAGRVGGIMSLVQPYWPSNLQLIYMDMAGICVSSGSACSSGKVKASRVVAAMGRPDLADKVLRVSGGWTTRAEDWHHFYDVWSKGYEAFLMRHTKRDALKEGA